jgi:hypothetical protein
MMARPKATPGDTPRKIRKFWMSEQMHTKLGELAWQRNTTASELIRAHLVDISINPLNPKAMADVDAPSTKNSVSVAVDDELYYGAKDAAYPTRKSLTSLLRRRIMLDLQNEGLWEEAA